MGDKAIYTLEALHVGVVKGIKRPGYVCDKRITTCMSPSGRRVAYHYICTLLCDVFCERRRGEQNPGDARKMIFPFYCKRIGVVYVV